MGTVLQCRKFGFFDAQECPDENDLPEALKDADITSVSSGHGFIFIGDSRGFAHLIDRQHQITSFEAHFGSITHAVIHSSSNLAVTCCHSKKGGSEVKIWLPERPDVQGIPICARVINVDPTGFVSERGQVLAPVVTAIALHPNNTMMALGLSDGSVILHRGDVRRTRGVKSKLIVTFSSGSITNMHIRLTQNSCHLFVTTAARIYCVDIKNKDKETSVELDSVGCEPGCSSLSDSKHESSLLIAKSDAIYSYTTDSKASCYVFDGNKKILAMHKGYLIVAYEETTMPSYKEDSSINLTIYDPLNKLICLSTTVDNICGVVYEWGIIYVITNKPSLIHLVEKDLQSKFEILFKKNQFDIAISLAKVQCCDAEDVAEIVKQYGDWLYGKGNFSSAMDQYIKTIPHLEPSYIIKKYLDIQHVQYLTTFLQALHKSGHSTSDHTMLLLNCYTRIQDSDQLNDFIMDKQGKLDCDVDIGIKVCRNAGYFDHALALAQQYKRHNHYLSIVINEKHAYNLAIKYISSLPLEDAHQNILQFGSTLLNHCPQETTDLLFRLCTEYTPSHQSTPNGIESTDLMQANPEEFEYLLVGHSEAAVNFLERLLKHRQLSPHLNTTLLAELLQQYSLAPEGQIKRALHGKILNMLRNDQMDFNRDHALLLCDKHLFNDGKLILWEQAGMFEELLTWHADHGDYDSVLDTCQRRSETNNRLWCLALRLCTTKNSSPNPSLIRTILNKIEESNLMPPMEVVEILSSSPNISLEDVRDYLMQVIAAHSASASNEVNRMQQHQQKTTEMKDNIEKITHNSRDFTGTKCSVCKNSLDLPTIHFLCKHSFHMHCFESYTEAESECPLCLSETKKIKESSSSKISSSNRHLALQDQLEKSTNCFSVVADFISQGALTNYQTLATLNPSLNTTKIPDLATRKEGMGTSKPLPVLSEGRLRLSEEPTKTLERESEGRLRQGMPLPETKNSPKAIRSANTGGPQPSSIESFISQPSTKSINKKATPTPISSSVTNSKVASALSENPFESNSGGSSANPFDDPQTESCSKNPFDEGDDYDESKNPFAGDSPVKKTEGTSQNKSENPFDDYDESLNPFGES